MCFFFGIDQALDVFEGLLADRILRRRLPGFQEAGQGDAGDAGRFVGAPAAVLVLSAVKELGRFLGDGVPGFLVGADFGVLSGRRARQARETN